MPVWLAVALGGALGSLCRYGMGIAAKSVWPQLPVATLLVNVLGSFAMGWISGYCTLRPEFAAWLRVGLMTGVLGGFTTFSAFSLETLCLLRDGAIGPAVVNMLSNLMLGIGACALGLYLGGR